MQTIWCVYWYSCDLKQAYTPWSRIEQGYSPAPYTLLSVNICWHTIGNHFHLGNLVYITLVRPVQQAICRIFLEEIRPEFLYRDNRFAISLIITSEFFLHPNILKYKLFKFYFGRSFHTLHSLCINSQHSPVRHFRIWPNLWGQFIRKEKTQK